MNLREFTTRVADTAGQKVYLDAAAYCGMAVCSAVAAAFNNNDVYAYVSAPTAFWIRTVASVSNAGFLALKLYTSTTFSDHKRNDHPTPGNGGISPITQSQPPVAGELKT